VFSSQIAVGSNSMTESTKRMSSRLAIDVAVIVASAIIISAVSFWVGVL
jgi:hypothetical protein